MDATGAWTIGTLLNAQTATLTLAATVTVAGAITNRALIVAQDQARPAASNNFGRRRWSTAQANADVGVTTIADRPAPLVGGTVTFTVTGERRRLTATRVVRHRCAARRSHVR